MGVMFRRIAETQARPRSPYDFVLVLRKIKNLRN